MNSGPLTKVEIKAFTDKGYNTPGDPDRFVIPINPENFSRSLEVKYEDKAAQGSQGTDPKYVQTKEEQIKFEFTLDATNTLRGYDLSQQDKPVPQQLEDFLRTVYFMNGSIHKPHYLKIIWGKQFTFDCILTNVDINYTLFHPNGEPLRAKVSATFKGTVEQEKRLRLEDKNSPDLTHVLPFTADQTLPLMVHKIYGDQSYLLQVARANELTSFRTIKAGKDLLFPPLQK